MTRLAPILLCLTGCATPQFTDPAYFHREQPGPIAQARRDAQRKAIDEDQTHRVKLAAMRAHLHRMATNSPPMPYAKERP